MKIGKEVKIGLGVISLLLVIFGYVAYRRLADSHPPEPLIAMGETPVEEAGATDAAGADTSGSDGMLSRMRKSPAEAASDPPEPSWSRTRSKPEADEHAGHDHAAPKKPEPKHEPKPVVRPAHRENHASSSAFDTRPKTAAAEETTTEEEPGVARTGEPRTLPDVDDVPAYARARLERAREEAAEAAIEEAAPEPELKSSRRPLQVQVPHEEHEHNRNPLERDREHEPARPQSIAIRGAQPGAVREVVNHEDSMARPDMYNATPRTTHAAPAHASPAHSTPLRPHASGVSLPHDSSSPYAHGNEYNATPHGSSNPNSKDYSDSSKYGVRPGEPAPLEHHHSDRYEVQPNDSYWVIAARIYGSGAYFKALYEHNRGKYPWADKLKVGDKIATPTVALLQTEYPDLCPRPRSHAGSAARQAFHPSARPVSTGRSYQVREGDTLFDIARYELGKASRWTEIYELNRDRLADDFDYLPPGTMLALPTGAPAARPGTNEAYHSQEPYNNERVTGRPQPGVR